MLYDPRKSNVSRIERESGVKFEHLPAPQPTDIAKVSGLDAAKTITQVADTVIPIFKSAAEELLNSSGLSAVELLAKALAKTAGYITESKRRTLLTSMENNVILLLETGKPIYTPSFAFSILKWFLPEEKVHLSVQGLSLRVDGKGVVFDVPAGDFDTFLAGLENAAGVSLEVVTTLPKLQEREQSSGRFGNCGGSRFGGRGGGGFSD